MEDLELAPGVSLLTQNELADAVYFLKSGAVKILVNGEMVAQIDKVQCFGEMSCLTPDTPASASVVTAKKSLLIRIAKDDFLNSVNQITKLWKTLFLQMSQRVRSLNGRFSEVLNHLPQGLMKISADGIVSNDYSVQCTRYFQKDNLAGYSFPKLAFPDDLEKQTSWLENLSLLFSESNMSFEMCANLLTSEFSLGHDSATKHFAMTYAACKNALGKVIAVDIGIEDITKQKELERKHKEIKLRQEILSKVTQSPDSFVNFLALSEEVFLETADFLLNLKTHGPASVKSRIEQLMRRLHSLKGISGVFSLYNFKSVVHDAETIVSKVKSSDENLLTIENSLAQILNIMNEEKKKAQDIFNEIPSDLRRRLTGVVFSQDEFQAIKTFVEMNDLSCIHKLLSSVEKVDCKKLVTQWPQEAQKIADALGKSVQFNISGEGGRIAKDTFTKLDNVLIHLLRNALDHGLESPDERTKKGKSPQGRITAMIDVSESEFLLVVEDDGRGIDRDSLVKRARQKQDLDQSLIDSYVSRSEEWRILLMSGVSTAKEVTDLSGRGVGLDAVASAIASMGGSLTIESTIGEGLCIFISVPI
jgi:two-component system chemotaxis sensor kinase CheA